MIKKYCELNNMKFMKVSAKNGLNVTQAYHSLVQDAYTYSYSRRKGRTVPVIISEKDKSKGKEKKKCC